jgi:hypothetical protein
LGLFSVDLSTFLTDFLHRGKLPVLRIRQPL